LVYWASFCADESWLLQNVVYINCVTKDGYIFSTVGTVAALDRKTVAYIIFIYAPVIFKLCQRHYHYQGGHKPGKPEILRDFSEHGKLREFCATLDKNCNKKYF